MDPEEAVPAQSEPIETPVAESAPTPTQFAVIHDDVLAFRNARRAERPDPKTNEPRTPAPAPAPAEPVAAASVIDEPARTVSKRQQQINDYERRIAEQAAELTRLRVPPVPVAPAPPSAARFPEYAAYLDQHPEATLEAWLDARDDWRDTQRSAAERQRFETTRAEQEAVARATAFQTRIAAVAGDNPQAFLDAHVSAEVQALAPREVAIAQGRPITPENDLASEVMEAEHPAELLTYLSDHPDALAQLRASQNRGAVIRRVARLDARFDASPAAPVPSKTVSDAPRPPTTLGSRPATAADPVRAAVVADDVGAFRRARREERLAGTR